jgi:ribosomal protein S16
MITKINLQSKNKRNYKIIVSNLKNNKYKIIDKIGIYNINNNYIILNKDKLKYWISIGAILTDKLIYLLKKSNNLPH